MKDMMAKLLIAAVCAATGCARHPSTLTVRQDVHESLPYSTGAQNTGVVNYIWEEPMVDVIDVPPGLDPEGHYYRPAHQEVVEVRQGRWQYYRNQSNGDD